MKHLKTFESFSYTSEVEVVDEGIFGDIKKKMSNFFKEPLNEQRKKLIESGLGKIDTDKVKFMQVKGADETKKEFDIKGFSEMAIETDNYNGSLKVYGDIAFYIPGKFSGSNDGGFGSAGNMAS